MAKVQEGEERIEGARVVIVDNNEANLRFLRRVLRRWGMIPLTARARKSAGFVRRIEFVGGGTSRRAAGRRHDRRDAVGLARRMQTTVRKPLPVVLVLARPLDAEQREVSKNAGLFGQWLKPYADHPCSRRCKRRCWARHNADAVEGWRYRAGLECAKLRILVAEDNTMNQRLIARILEKMGHEVVVADDGRRALEKLAQGGFDLVAMDMQMPVMDGLETTREIRSREQASGGTCLSWR